MQDWVEKNPDRWYTATYEDISVETGVSPSTLYRYFPLIVAEATGLLPSEVLDKRREHLGTSPWRRKLSQTEIQEIVDLFNEGKTGLDIAFMTGRSLSQVEKHRPNKKTRGKQDE